MILSIRLLITLLTLHRLDNTWNDVEPSLKIVQTIAVMEILHALFGIVRSPVGVVFGQVSSRIWTLWAIMNVAPPARTTIFCVLACTSWGLVEVPRYLFYALNLVDAIPDWLFWLRYSLFAVLYPTVISGEIGCMFYAYQYLTQQASPSELAAYTFQIQGLPIPPITLSHVIIAIMILYVPGSPYMFMNMVNNRKREFKKKWPKEGAKKVA